MEPAVMVLPLNYASPDEIYLKRHKRMKMSSDVESYSSTTPSTSVKHDMKVKTDTFDYSDPFSIKDLLDDLSSGKYGSVTKEIKELIDRKVQIFGPLLSQNPSLSSMFVDAEKLSGQGSKSANRQAHHSVIDLEEDCVAVGVPSKSPAVVVLSDDEDEGDKRPSYPFREVRLMQPPVGPFLTEIQVRGNVDSMVRIEEQVRLAGETVVEKDKGVYVGVEGDDDNQNKAGDDGLGDIWQEMSMAMEISKDVAEDNSSAEHMGEDADDCDHSFVLKDDLGYVCRICGVIDRGIETIIDVQFNKSLQLRSSNYTILL